MGYSNSRWARWLGGLALCMSASVVLGQTPGFNVRLIDTVDEPFDDAAGGHDHALDVLSGSVNPALEFDNSLNYPFIDFRQTSGGRFPTDQLLPDFRPLNTDRNNYIMEATATLTIPAGDWAIGFGSDDGGALRLDGVEFDFTYQHDGEETPQDQLLNTPGYLDFNVVPRKGTRGHNWSWGTFSVDSETTVQLTANLSDNAGGDNWELAITPYNEIEDIGTDADPNAFNRTPAPARGWELLANGTLGWGVTTDITPSRQVAVGGAGSITNEPLPGTLIDAEFGGGGAVVPGLLQRFYNIANSAAVRNNFPSSVIDELTHTPEPFTSDPSWWSGSGGAPGLPRYHQALLDAGGWDANDHSNYTAFLDGEILFEKNGTYRFRDAVDDFTYLAIDIDESGVAGDDPSEILLNDNAWTNIRGNRSGAGVVDDNASPEAVVDISGVGPDGKWLAIQFGMAEGGGGDRGVLMWDYDVATQTVGGAVDFPLEGEGVAADNLVQNIMIPNSHLRTELPDQLQSGIRELKLGEFPVAGNDIAFEFEVSSDLLKSDRIMVDNSRTPDLTTTRIDFTGAKIAVIETGDMIKGDRFKLAEADEIVGGDQVTFVFDDASQWDTSQFASRAVIEFIGGDQNPLDCNGDGVVDIADANCTADGQLDGFLASLDPPSLRGDADGDGQVQFSDFVILSDNFTMDGQYTDGDFDKDGVVQFSDFVILSERFGQTGGGAVAAAVPEPSSIVLLGLGGLLLGMVRRRRTTSTSRDGSVHAL